MVSILINGLASVFLFVALYLLADLIRTIRKQRRKRPRPRRTPSKINLAHSKINPALEERLLTRVGGNRALAHRLVRLARRNQPGRSDDWYCEKVIYDLERDRR